jgi:HlyD family secretion protein
MLRNTLKTRSPFLTFSLTAAVVTAATLAAIGHPARSDEAPAARRDQPPGKVDPAPPEGRARVVATEPARKTDLRRTTTQAATVHAYESVDVYSRVSGYLKSVKVDIGDVVKRGQLVAEVEVPELGAELARDEAILAQARASVVQMQARLQVAGTDLMAARMEVLQQAANVKKTESTQVYRKLKLERYRGLRQRNAVSQEIFDEVEEQSEAAFAQEEAAKADLELGKTHVRKAEQEVDASKATVAEAEARVHVAEATLARTKVLVDQARIVSPLDGTVTRRNVSEGEFVRTGDATNAPPIATIVRTDKVRVVVQVPDGDVPLLKRGQRATIRIDALSSSPPLTGTVSRFAEAESPSDRTMRTEIDLDNAEGRLRPGQYGAVTIILRERHGVLTIPASAIAGRGRNGQADCIRVEGNHARLTQIQTGEEDGDRVEVISGLKEGEVVVTQPVVGLRDGQVIETEKRPEPGKP